MTGPVIAAEAPLPPDAEAGKYGWCTCDQGAKQPFCDGRHKKR